MTDSDPNVVNMKNVKIKMPEENFLNPVAEVPSSSNSAKPLILFGLVLILIGILGGLLWWGTELIKPPTSIAPIETRPVAATSSEPISTSTETIVANTQTVNTSDELVDIQADLASTSVDNLTDELQTIDVILQTNSQ